jgi:hypothetical protein
MRKSTDTQKGGEKSVTKGEKTEDTSRAQTMSGCEQSAPDINNNHWSQSNKFKFLSKTAKLLHIPVLLTFSFSHVFYFSVVQTKGFLIFLFFCLCWSFFLLFENRTMDSGGYSDDESPEEMAKMLALVR